MSEIDTLQQRLTAAMDRIATGMGALGHAAQEGTAALSSALEDERTANAQLSERVRILGERAEAAEAAEARAAHAMQTAAEEARAGAAAQTETLDLELQQLRQANDRLRASNAALRAANAEGVGDPDLINAALSAELDSLRAARAADVAEASGIIAALGPLLDQLDAPAQDPAQDSDGDTDGDYHGDAKDMSANDEDMPTPPQEETR